MKCKVFQFISGLNDGGAETLVKDYACLLDKERFEVKIVTIHNVTNTANYRRAIENNLSLISIYSHYNILTRTFNKIFGRWYVPYRLKKLVEEERPNCIHGHLVCLKYLKPISKHIKNVKIFYTCHSLPRLKFEGRSKAEGKAARYLIKHNGLQLIALHREMADTMNQMFGINNTVIVKNGCDFSRFCNVDETKEDIRSSLNIPQDAYVIGHVGRITKLKNHSFLLDVFAKTKQIRENSYLLIIGSGPLEDEIRQKVESAGLADSAVMLSHRTDIPRLLKAMDVFVFPSLFEGLSVTLVEAQASGLRCVISDTINPENVLSKNTVQVDLSKTADEWRDIAMDESIVSNTYGNLADYDMNTSIKYLETLYLQD